MSLYERMYGWHCAWMFIELLSLFSYSCLIVAGYTSQTWENRFWCVCSWVPLQSVNWPWFASIHIFPCVWKNLSGSARLQLSHRPFNKPLDALQQGTAVHPLLPLLPPIPSQLESKTHWMRFDWPGSWTIFPPSAIRLIWSLGLMLKCFIWFDLIWCINNY